MLFFIESIIACLSFHIIIYVISRNREEVFINDYPPIIIEKLRSKRIIAQNPPAKKKDIIRKVIALIIYAILFALLLRFINKITTFSQASLTAYGLWLVVDWYDFFVIDVLCASFDKFYKLSGISAYNKEALFFHFKGSLRGMILGIFCALIVGLIVHIMF